MRRGLRSAAASWRRASASWCWRSVIRCRSASTAARAASRSGWTLAVEWLEPVGDGASRCRLCGVVGRFGELSASGGGGGVGSVVGDDVVEEVACGVEVVVVGDDEELVGVAAAGGADVEAASSGCGGDEFDADVDGVGLVAVFGGGVAELDVLGDVVVRAGRRDRRRVGR